MNPEKGISRRGFLKSTGMAVVGDGMISNGSLEGAPERALLPDVQARQPISHYYVGNPQSEPVLPGATS